MTAAADPTPETTADLDAAVEEPTSDAAESSAGVEEPTSEDAAEQTGAAPAEADAASEAAADETAVDETAPAESEPVEAAEAAEVADAQVAAEPEAAESAEPAAAPAPVPHPSPRPMPTPKMVARPKPPVAAPRPAETAPAAAPTGEPWGRVEDDGTVSVREGDEWRVVGQYPDGTTDEALAYFERKFADLVSEVTLLEVRHHSGGASASDLRATAKLVRDKITGAAAVGDLASLEARVAALTQELSVATQAESAAAREAVDEAVKARTALVEKAEALAARDPRSVQWKQASVDMTELFDAWQAQQKTGPRLPKAAGQQLWKRFRDARATVDKHRREFYAELDEAHKGVRERKAKLVERAEALAPKGEDGIAAYRELLDQWKTAGRAGKKADDALWARFKAAGDALYSARGEREAVEAEESREKIVQKRALLVEAKAVADEPEIAKARQLLTSIQRQWDEIGRIFPRDAERTLDDDLRKVENALRTREETDWKRNNPETKARANDMTRQLTDAIEKLEGELAAAKKSGDASKIAQATDALEARKGWLRALGG